MARENEFVIIQKTYDLVKWCCDHTSRFPRNHRFSLGARIERRLYDLLETLIQARYTRERRGLLLDANLHLEILRHEIRLAKELNCLRLNSYAHFGKLEQEIGRMIGGWMKHGPRPEESR